MENNQNHIHPLRPALSIIIPIPNEIELLPELMTYLQYWQQRNYEILLFGGGSNDASAEQLAKEYR
ncbi:MAG: hypothetical protein WCY88_16820 [Spongiibacteraceae bacterium]